MKSTSQASRNRRRNRLATFPVGQFPPPQTTLENPGWFEYIPGGFVITDVSGAIQSANQEACEILHVSRDRAQGALLAHFIQPEDRPAFENQIRNCLGQPQGGKISSRLQAESLSTKVVNFSLRSAASSHSRQPLLYWTLYPVPGEDDPNREADRERAEQAEAAVRYKENLLLDAITEHRRVQSALKTSTAHFRTIFEQADLGIQLLDLQGMIVESNPAFQKMMGYSLEELHSKRLTDITHLEDLEDWQSEFNLVVRGKIDTYRSQVRLIHQNGQVVWTRQIMSLFRNEDNQPQYVINMVENITPQKHMELELSEVQQRLIESREAERLRLAQDLHDGPVQDLYGISYQLSSLWSSFGDPVSYPQVKTIESSLESVIQSLRQVCGELRPPSLAPFGLEKAIVSHAQGIREKNPDLNLSLDLMVDRKALPENIRLAFFRIYQIAMANVIRHANAKNVLVHFSFDAEEVLLTVQDDGKGFQMPLRWVELVRQGHFGLVGAAERAQSIGGEMTIESQPGKGTVLRIHVPRAAPSASESIAARR